MRSITFDKLAVFMLDSDLFSKSFSVLAIRSDRYLFLFSGLLVELIGDLRSLSVSEMMMSC